MNIKKVDFKYNSIERNLNFERMNCVRQLFIDNFDDTSWGWHHFARKLPRRWNISNCEVGLFNAFHYFFFVSIASEIRSETFFSFFLSKLALFKFHRWNMVIADINCALRSFIAVNKFRNVLSFKISYDNGTKLVFQWNLPHFSRKHRQHFSSHPSMQVPKFPFQNPYRWTCKPNRTGRSLLLQIEKFTRLEFILQYIAVSQRNERKLSN